MIDFSGYTAKAIEKAMLGRVSNSLDKREGSLIQTAIGPAAWYIEGMYMVLDQLQQNAFASTAVGQALDYKALERGIMRKGATLAVRSIKRLRSWRPGKVFTVMKWRVKLRGVLGMSIRARFYRLPM